MFKSFLNTIKTAQFWIMAVIALVMLNNIEHLAYVHYIIARHLFPTYEQNWWHSILVVIIIELSIIVLVNKGQENFALVYTLCLFALSLIYYPLDEYWQNGQYGRFMAAIIYSLMFTISIYYFARMAAERSYENSKLLNRTRELDEARAELQEVRAKLQQSEANLNKATAECRNLHFKMVDSKDYLQQLNDTISEQKNELQQCKTELHQLRKFKQQIEAACTCEKCGQTFESEASKRSHTGKCKGKEVKEAA
jgi:Membrane-bound metallopeptidase